MNGQHNHPQTLQTVAATDHTLTIQRVHASQSWPAIANVSRSVGQISNVADAIVAASVTTSAAKAAFVRVS